MQHRLHTYIRKAWEREHCVKCHTHFRHLSQITHIQALVSYQEGSNRTDFGFCNKGHSSRRKMMRPMAESASSLILFVIKILDGNWNYNSRICMKLKMTLHINVYFQQHKILKQLGFGFWFLTTLPLSVKAHHQSNNIVDCLRRVRNIWPNKNSRLFWLLELLTEHIWNLFQIKFYHFY